MSAPYDIEAVEHIGGRRLRLTFVDGLVGDVDLTPKFEGALGPMFEPLRDITYFAQATVDEELRTVIWPNGADLAPDVLHTHVMSLT
ncbi:MAG: DUF2442 domain-containing protein [Actinomycetia bacterium]|nr:DUF2442 domain-containing protein [Actinomycetes bacterium]MCP4957991.1 DUF2442 domain-containing protein [Actinomycetes bacterium]